MVTFSWPKVSAAGKPLWRRVYDGPAHGDDVGSAIAVDAAGNAYVTGSSASLVNGSDAITLKFSTSGAGLWAGGTTAWLTSSTKASTSRSTVPDGRTSR